MISLDFYLKWGSMYQINSFGCERENVMFLGRSNGFIICCSESGLHTDWLSKGYAIQIPSAMAENVYMVPESVFYPRNRGQHPEHAYESKNFETVDAMINMGLITKDNACQDIAEMWQFDENSPANIVNKWFVDKLLGVNDLKKSQSNLIAYLRISESMLKKYGVKKSIIDIYIKFMAINGASIISNAEERVEIIRLDQVNQLPF